MNNEKNRHLDGRHSTREMSVWMVMSLVRRAGAKHGRWATAHHRKLSSDVIYLKKKNLFWITKHQSHAGDLIWFIWVQILIPMILLVWSFNGKCLILQFYNENRSKFKYKVNYGRFFFLSYNIKVFHLFCSS